MQYKFTITLMIVCLLTTNEALRILLVFPIMSKSHSILGNAYARHLLEAGHEVVLITTHPNEKPVPNLKEIDVSSILSFVKAEAEKRGVFDIKNVSNVFSDSVLFTFVTYLTQRGLLKEPEVVELFSDPNEKFDAVIIEWFFSEVTAGIGPLFQCPLIWAASTEPHWQFLRLGDEIPNPAYTVDMYSQNQLPLNFWGRITELYKIVRKSLIISVFSLLERFTYNAVYPEIAAKRGVDMPSYDEAKYNASLLFINSHPSIGSSFKLPQNAISIGGYHIDDKIEPLPKDLQKLMDKAEHGVIYFSMGSISRSSGMTDTMKQTLLGIFGKLKETVIWKYEAEMDKNPANVHLIKWAPQQSILAHPNLKLFITHGGLLSTTESLYYGVPLIGLPLGADQHINMRSVERKGFGILVTIAEEMADELTAAINEILSNNSYKARAKELSQIFHDRPVAPGKELVHWVEHVVTTRGALHLRSPALHVPLYQKLYLDLLAVIVLIVTVLYKIIRKYINSRSKTKTHKKLKSM